MVTGGGGESGFTSKVTEVGLSDLVRGGVCTVVGVLGTDSISRKVKACSPRSMPSTRKA